ncbi:MAG: S9 family peptidase [Bacteroidales bacterium]|nr:S9 family peptidase [Bacteroidales bacterium]
MKKIQSLIVTILIILVITGCQQTVEKPPVIDVEDFFKKPEKVSFQVSPDGAYLSFMGPYEEKMNVFVMKTGEEEARRITNETERSLYGYGWANNNTILYIKDVGGDENLQILSVNVETGEGKAVFAKENVRAEILDILRDQPDEILITINERNPQVFDPYRFNLVTGELTRLAENPGDITGWDTDHDGKLRIASATDGVNIRLLYRDSEQEEFREIKSMNFKESFSPMFFDFNNENIYCYSDLGRDKGAFVLYDPRTDEELEVVFETDEVDVDNLAYSRKRKVLTSASYITDKTHRHFFDPMTEKMYSFIEKELPGYEISIVSKSREEDLFIVNAGSDRTYGSYYLYDDGSKSLTFIAEITPWLKEEHMAGMKPVAYTSRDGLTIHGYLTLPVGMENKNLPIVVNPHGGPWARDYWGFNPEVQFLANRGFGVLQMNFRSSTGYGKEFWQKGFGEWGRTMQDDISDGVQWLIDKGIGDPDRIAIYGASYGGYAVLAGMTLTPELYCCGVDYVGVANMFTFMNTIPPYWEPLRDMFYEMVGDPVKDSLRLAEVSPVQHVDKIRAPMFIAQGARDPRVNKDESDQMVEALRERGIEVEYMVKENEGHGFYEQQNQFDFYNAMIEFLDNHMKSEP